MLLFAAAAMAVLIGLPLIGLPAAEATEPVKPAAASVGVTEAAPASNRPRPCEVKGNLARLELRHSARLFARGQPLKIVAIGSSSTAGAGASSPAASYPSQLAADLAARFPGRRITVLNRGVNGEVATDMVARFKESVLDEHPDVVLWQVGTNSVLRDEALDPARQTIRNGLKLLKASGTDVVLIDPQYAPKVLAKPDSVRMVKLLSDMAKEADVDLFERYALMQRWHDLDGMDFASFIAPDGLHMNDWSYACVAKALGASIGEALTRPTAHAAVLHYVP